MDAVLGHIIPGIGGIYDRYSSQTEKGEALAAWGRHLPSAVGIADNVVAI